MFPRLRQRLGTELLGRLDVFVELSTLGEYGLGEDGLPLALDCDADLAPRTTRTRDVCPLGGRPTPRRCEAALS